MTGETAGAKRRGPRILFAVTAQESIVLLGDMPQHFRDSGWDVHIVSSPGEHPRKLSVLAGHGLTIHTIPMRRDPSPLRDLIALLRWVLLMRRVCPDAVLVGTPKSGLLGIVSAWTIRVPVRGYLLRGLRLETTAGWRRRVLTSLERFAARRATHVFAISQSLRQKAIHLEIASASAIETVGQGSSHGVDLNRFVPRIQHDTVRTRTKLTVGFVGRITRDKGIGDLLTAMSQPDLRTHCSLLLVGPVEDPKLRASLDRFVKLGAELTEIGPTETVQTYYQQMDVLCLPSWREGFGNVVIEAAACGVPSIVSDATGVVDTVRPNITGLVFPTGDSSALASAIRSMHDLDLRQRLGRAARDHVERHFDQNIVNALYEERIRFLVQGEAGRSNR